MLQENVAVLDCLREDMAVCSVLHKYGQNESSIDAIKVCEKEICGAVAASVPLSAKVLGYGCGVGQGSGQGFGEGVEGTKLVARKHEPQTCSCGWQHPALKGSQPL